MFCHRDCTFAQKPYKHVRNFQKIWSSIVISSHNYVYELQAPLTENVIFTANRIDYIYIINNLIVLKKILHSKWNQLMVAFWLNFSSLAFQKLLNSLHFFELNVF